VRLAFLGYGSIARQYARALLALNGLDVQLASVMGRVKESADEFAAEFGIPRSTTSLDDVLHDEAVDAVVITSPSELHADQTALCLSAGKHVLCEIPLATSLGDVDRLIELADRTDRRLMVCHTQRYYPALLEARRQIARGGLTPYSIVSRYMFQRRANVNWVGRQRSWTDNLLWHHGCHAVDAALWLLGATAADVQAQIARPSGPLGIPMDLAIALRTPADQIVSVAMSYNTHVALHDYVIIGEERTLIFSEGELRSNEGVLVEKRSQTDLNEPIMHQDAEFLSAVLEQREPAVSGRSVRPAMAVLQAVQERLAQD
jgi:2-hydroxy-4-carboxymuconate semialdehyde hemiacetal dehydrogenase